MVGGAWRAGLREDAPQCYEGEASGGRSDGGGYGVMRAFFLRCAGAMLGLAAAACDVEPMYGDPNEIVFGIEQGTDEAGAPAVSAGYEYLGLSGARGPRWAPISFRDEAGDATCYFERYDARLGRPHVESGLATWSGADLPAGGLAVRANADVESAHAGPGWRTGDALLFEATGFAMPALEPVKMRVPRTDLAIEALTPVPVAEAMTIAADGEVALSWTPPEDPDGTRVLLSLHTEVPGAEGDEVRCFASASAGTIVVPRDWTARLFAAVPGGVPVAGHVRIATHRQVTYQAQGNWVAYLVATSLVRSVPFTGTR